MADRDLTKLKPEFKNKVDKFLAEAKGIFVTEAWRSDERQKELVEQGLSFVEVSNHQLGLAIDIAFEGPDLYPADYGRWRTVADIAARYGIDWGYDMWNWDMPHFQDNGEPLVDESVEKQIKANEVILSRRIQKAWKEVEEANPVKKHLAELKQVPYKPYIIIEQS